jgi:hypothetical protein
VNRKDAAGQPSSSAVCGELNDRLPRYLIHDHDRKSAAHGDALLGDARSKAIRLPVQSPNLNAYAQDDLNAWLGRETQVHEG